jgi:hypothetical protein
LWPGYEHGITSYKKTWIKNEIQLLSKLNSEMQSKKRLIIKNFEKKSKLTRGNSTNSQTEIWERDTSIERGKNLEKKIKNKLG